MSEETENLTGKYKARGFQQMTLAEYRALKTKEAKRPKFKVPPHIQFILGTPFLIIFCFGLFFIPYLIYSAVIAKPAKTGEKTSAYEKVSRSDPAR